MRKLFGCSRRSPQSDINVLIEGESGTGKELVATEIVQRGPRADKPFVIVDCGAISPNLVESELFGHVRGAFTGADRDRIGAFEAADGGTVFLDEIGELPLELQPKLLRAIEAREIRRVGETRARKVNVRVVAATNRDLEREVNKARFREDLYFRLAVIQVRVPPLRERIDDFPILIRHFLGQLGLPRRRAPLPARGAGRDGEARLAGQRPRAPQLRRAHGRPPDGEPDEPPVGAVEPALASQAVDIRIPFKLAKDAAVDTFERGYLGALLEACGGQHEQGGAHGRDGPHVPAPARAEARASRRRRRRDERRWRSAPGRVSGAEPRAHASVGLRGPLPPRERPTSCASWPVSSRVATRTTT